ASVDRQLEGGARRRDRDRNRRSVRRIRRRESIVSVHVVGNVSSALGERASSLTRAHAKTRMVSTADAYGDRRHIGRTEDLSQTRSAGTAGRLSCKCSDESGWVTAEIEGSEVRTRRRIVTRNDARGSELQCGIQRAAQRVLSRSRRRRQREHRKRSGKVKQRTIDHTVLLPGWHA